MNISNKKIKEFIWHVKLWIYVVFFKKNNQINTTLGVKKSYLKTYLKITEVSNIARSDASYVGCEKINRFQSIYHNHYHIKSNFSFNNVLKNDSVCLFFNRLDRAYDNAEILYSYMEDFSKRYFIISQYSKCYQRLIEKGFKIVIYGSKEFDKLYLSADYIFSSSYDRTITDYKKKGFKSRFKFVFLQHGCIFNDLKYQLANRFIDYIIISTKFEENYFSDYALFNEEQIIKSGLPRFGEYKINSCDLNEGLIFLTWCIADAEVQNYFSLIKKVIKRSKLKYNVVLHPNMEQYAPKNMEFSPFEDLTMLIKKSKFLITDFSSIMYDFAKQKKHVFLIKHDSTNLKSIHKSYGILGADTPGHYVDLSNEIDSEIIKKLKTPPDDDYFFESNGCPCQVIIDHLTEDVR